MTELEQLNERIAQLSELVKTGSEAIKSMETALKAAKEERDRLAVQQKETEPKFERVKENEEYYTIDFDGYRSCVVNSDTEEGHPLDEKSYDNNNYFYTEKRAQKIADKINLLLKLERLYDIYCPNCEGGKYYISQNTESGKYCYGYIRNVPNKYPTSTMFPNEEIAQKVCDILNAELEEKK